MILDQSVLGVEKYTPCIDEDFDWAEQYSLIKLSYEATLEADNQILSSIINENNILNESDEQKTFSISGLFVAILKGILHAIIRIFTTFINIIVKIISGGKISSKIQAHKYEKKIRDYTGKVIIHNYRPYTNIDDIKIDSNIKIYFEPILEDRYRQLENLILTNRVPEILESKIKELYENLDTDTEIKRFLRQLVDINFDDISIDNFKNTLIDKMYGKVVEEQVFHEDEVYKKFYQLNRDADIIIGDLKNEKMSIERSVEKAIRDANKKFDNNKLFKFLNSSPRSTNMVKSAAINYERKIISIVQREASYITTFYGIKLQGYKDRQAQAKKALTSTIQKIIQKEGDRFVDKVFD